ncbi:MAG: hypothetical protein EA375_01015, partial [Acholeplasmataceae bacterium]
KSIKSCKHIFTYIIIFQISATFHIKNNSAKREKALIKAKKGLIRIVSNLCLLYGGGKGI